MNKILCLTVIDEIFLKKVLKYELERSKKTVKEIEENQLSEKPYTSREAAEGLLILAKDNQESLNSILGQLQD